MTPLTERDAQILVAYDEGRSLRQVADDFGVSHETVRQMLLRDGRAVRSRSDAMKRRRAVDAD